jgi:hypothetical protein
MGFWGQQQAPVKQPLQDDRLTGYLRWIGTLCSGFSLFILIGITGVIVSLRDGQIRMELMFNELEKKVEKGEDINETQNQIQQKNIETNLRQDLAILELQRKLSSR